MPKIDGPKLSRHHLTLYEEDYEILRKLFKGKMGISRAVRDIVHQSLKSVREKTNTQSYVTHLPESVEVDIGDINVESVD